MFLLSAKSLVLAKMIPWFIMFKFWFELVIAGANIDFIEFWIDSAMHSKVMKGYTSMQVLFLWFHQVSANIVLGQHSAVLNMDSSIIKTCIYLVWIQPRITRMINTNWFACIFMIDASIDFRLGKWGHCEYWINIL